MLPPPDHAHHAPWPEPPRPAPGGTPVGGGRQLRADGQSPGWTEPLPRSAHRHPRSLTPRRSPPARTCSRGFCCPVLAEAARRPRLETGLFSLGRARRGQGAALGVAVPGSPPPPSASATTPVPHPPADRQPRRCQCRLRAPPSYLAACPPARTRTPGLFRTPRRVSLRAQLRLLRGARPPWGQSRSRAGWAAMPGPCGRRAGPGAR